MFGALLLEGKQRVSPFFRDLFRLLKLGSDFHERNVDESFAQSRQQLGTRDFHHGKQRVSPFYHDLVLDLVGLIWNFLLVDQLLLLVVEQLLNSILSSSHVSRKSLEEAEVMHLLFRI